VVEGAIIGEISFDTIVAIDEFVLESPHLFEAGIDYTAMKPRRAKRPIAIWSAVGLFAFYAAADCFLTYRGLPSPLPIHLVEKIAEDKGLDPWHQRNKTLFPGLILTALIGTLAHHFGYRCAASRPSEPRKKRMALPFGLARASPTSDQQWLYWGFIALFHLVPFTVTAYLASEFFQHPNLYYRGEHNQQVWVRFFSAETWNFAGLFHRRPILWTNDIELQRGIFPLFLLLTLGLHTCIFFRFAHALLRKRVLATGHATEHSR